ncbi:MAG TPA: MFS transporter, partial [Aggregatilineales bacterium]|nr:MFS transporter [Aggregatilineales bacterium]
MNRLYTFYILVVTQIFSLIGSRMTGIAVGIQIFRDTGNTSPLLIAAFFMEIPGMLSGSFTGLIADRFDRRLVIMVGDAGQAVGTLVLLLSYASGSFELWHLYAVMLVQGIFGTIQSPASDASITMLVPENHRDRANGINLMGFPLAGVIAPILTGVFYEVAGITGVMVFDLLTFAVAITVVFLIRIPRPEKSQASMNIESEGGFRRELLGGWHYLIQRRALLLMILYLSFIYFLINGPLEIAIPYFITITGSEETLGLLLAAMNLGALSGALAIAVSGNVRNRMRVIMVGFLILGVLFGIYGIVRSPILLGVTIFCILFPLPVTGALFSSIMQKKTPPDMQGRVFAISGQLFMLMTPFSFLLTGYLVDSWLEPAVGKTGWNRLTPLVGNDPGAGMGALMIAVG